MMKDKNVATKMMVQSAIIAAIYVVFSLLTYQFSYLEIQCRVAEALCMTIYFTPAGVWGVIIGCFLTNLFSGSVIDMAFGTLATVIAAFITRAMAVPMKKRCGLRPDIKGLLLLPLPTVLVNAVIIPFVLYYGYGIVTMGSATAKGAVLGLMAFSVGAGEILSCYVFGPILVNVLCALESKLGNGRQDS